MSCKCKKCEECEEQFEEMNQIIMDLEDTIHDKDVMIALLIYLIKLDVSYEV